MYKQNQEIMLGPTRRKVLMVDGRYVWCLSGPFDDAARRIDITSTNPIPLAGREFDGWRVPKRGDTYFEPAAGWLPALTDWVTTADDHLGFGWLRPVLKPLAKPDIVRGLEVDDRGVPIVRLAGGAWHELSDYADFDSHSPAWNHYSPADIALIRAGLPAEVKAYLAAKPADAEALLRESKDDDRYYGCYEAIDVLTGPALECKYLGRRRWIRRAAKPGTITTPTVIGGSMTIQPSPTSYVAAQVVAPVLPELWLMVDPVGTGGAHDTTGAYADRAGLAGCGDPDWVLVRVPATGGKSHDQK